MRDVLAMLPDTSFVKQYCYFAQWQSASHIIYHVASAFSLVGVTASRALVGEGPGFKAPTFANFYGLIIGAAGDSEKTLAIRIAQELLLEATPKLVGADPTAEETLVKMLDACPSMILVYPEFGKWLAGTSGENNLIGGKLRQGLTEFFDGLMITRQYSKGQSAIEVHNPRLSILGGCTPAHFEQYTTTIDTEGGFLSRIFYAYGERERVSYSRVPMPEHRSWLLSYLIRSATHGVNGETAGPCHGFEESTFSRWLQWDASLKERFGHLRNDSRRGAILSRVPLLCAKMAVALAWASGAAWGPHPWQLTRAELEPAIGFAELHLRAAMALVENIATSHEMREQRILYMAVGPHWKPIGACIKDAGLTHRRAKGYFETLLIQGDIETTTQNNVAFYRQVPGGRIPAYNYDIETLPSPTPTNSPFG